MIDRKLHLKREVLATLTSDDLRTVAGAGQDSHWTYTLQRLCDSISCGFFSYAICGS